MIMTMTLEEMQARAILLAQAFETSALLDDAELRRVDDEASLLALTASQDVKDMTRVIARRADILIARVKLQHPALVSSLDKPFFLRAMFFVPLTALVLGVGADRVANPHRVDLLSAPILVILAWNLVVYGVLVASFFRHASSSEDGFLIRWRHRFQSWGGRFGRQAEADPAARAGATFLRLWQPAAAALNAQRLITVMHVAAGAWALGIVLSLLGRGLFVAYGVGWESTWLDAAQVHFVLKALFAPLVALLPLDAFTLADIARLQVGAGSGGQVADGRRWALMYAGLLALVVIMPRLALAAWAATRSRRLSQQVRVDLDDPYFQRIIDNLFPAQVHMGVITHRATDQAALARVLQQVPAPLARLETPGTVCLIDTARGDTLWCSTISALAGPGVVPVQAASPAQLDMVLHVVGHAHDLMVALPQLQDLGRPVLMLVRTDEDDTTASAQLPEQCRQHMRSHDLAMDVLDFTAFGRCWPLEAVLLDAIAMRVPRSRTRGMARLQDSWLQRNLERFAQSVHVMGAALRDAAIDHAALPRLSVLDRLQPTRVRDHKDAKITATQAVQQRVHARFDRLLQDLLELHGLDAGVASELVFHAHILQFDSRGSVGASQAAMGGAASGAAVGASIDLLTGGLTLGAATALGALAGGSTALMSVIWSNRDTPDGGVRFTLGDDMLLALVQTCVLRYLAVIHVHRNAGDLHRAAQLEDWKAAVLEQVSQRRKRLLAGLDADSATDSALQDLVSQLRELTVAVLQKLYPGSSIPL